MTFEQTMEARIAEVQSIREEWRTASPDMKAAVAAVQAHAARLAERDYEWSVIDNCWEAHEIYEELKDNRLGAASSAVRHFARICSDRRDSDYGGKGSEAW